MYKTSPLSSMSYFIKIPKPMPKGGECSYLIFSRLVRGGAAACLKGVTLDGLSLSPVSLSAVGGPSTDKEDSLSLG